MCLLGVDDARQGHDRRRSCRSSTATPSSRPITRSSSTSCVKLYEQNRPIDAIILREELAKRQLLEEVGGIAYLAADPQLASRRPPHGAHYAGIVREKSLLRQLIAASNDILRDAYAPHEQAELVLDKAEKRIFDIAQKKVGGAMSPMEDVLHEVFEMIENRGQRGIETGFFELDDMINGLQNGEMIIVAARPSMGKTAFAMNMIEHIAADTRLPMRRVLAGNEQAAARAAHALQPRADRLRTSSARGCSRRTSTRTWRTSSASWPRRRSGSTTRRA